MEDNAKRIKAILVVLNECLTILGLPTLSKDQRRVLFAILDKLAHKPVAFHKPFTDRLVEIIGMKSRDEQVTRLRNLLGLEV